MRCGRSFPVVTAAATLHALASCVLGPAIAAISLGLVGPLAIGERLGRNARFASLGNGSAAALMGACGYFCRAGRCSWSRSFWRSRPCWRCRGSASGRSTLRRPWRGDARGARCQGDQRVQPDAQAAAADLCRRDAAVPTRQCGDAAADGGRGHDALEPVGAGPDRGLHHRAAGDRGADLAFGRAHRASLGPAAAAAAGVCGAGDPRLAVCDRAAIPICWSRCRCSTASPRPCSASWCR